MVAGHRCSGYLRDTAEMRCVKSVFCCEIFPSHQSRSQKDDLFILAQLLYTPKVLRISKKKQEPSFSPTSNSKPFSVNVWQHPPARSCCSRTKTFFPTLASNTASPSPPTPLPMMMASRSLGTLLARKPKDKANSTFKQQHQQHI